MFDSRRNPQDARGDVIVLGVDPGLANTGWGLVRVDGASCECLGYGCFTTPARHDPSRRLLSLYSALSDLIGKAGPSELAIEKIFFNVNVRTAFATGQARGIALLAAAAAGLAVGEYGPSEIKQAVVGYGAADKAQVAYMVRAMLSLKTTPKPEHAADALAVALCHANSRVLTLNAARAGGRR